MRAIWKQSCGIYYETKVEGEQEESGLPIGEKVEEMLGQVSCSFSISLDLLQLQEHFEQVVFETSP